MEKLKICIISTGSLPLYEESYNKENVIGGAEINLYNLALCLSHVKNVEVTVLVDDFGQPEKCKIKNIELIRFGSANNKNGLAGKLRNGRQLLSLEADAFILSCSNALLGKLVIFQRFIRGKKVLFRLSSDLNIDLQHFKDKEGYKNYLLYKFGLLNASSIVSQTEKQKSLLERELGRKSHVIENGFFIRGGTQEKEKKHILWVGRGMASKRPMLFIELAEILPDEQFVMIMPTNKAASERESKEQEETAKKVYQKAKTLNNLKMIDYIAFEKIQTYFDSAKVYVCTSELEGFPNTFIQACLGGTPILSYIVNPGNIIEKYGLGCCCNDNVKQAVSFIKEISKVMLDEYKIRMANYLSEKHNIFNTAEQYLKLIDDKFPFQV